MHNATLNHQDECLHLKADFLALTVIKIINPNREAIEKKLQATLQKAPHYFQHAPIIIDVSLLKINSLQVNEILTLMHRYQLRTVGVRGLQKTETEMALSLGIPLLKSTLHEEKIENKEKQDKINNNAFSKTKIITKPIRSGTQVYAKEGDLIILAGVNTGGECIAAGNIHIYGPLRGRALAGVNGDKEARIFCNVLEAELIAIAGYYQVNENIKAPTQHNGMLQIFLHQDRLKIDTI